MEIDINILRGISTLLLMLAFLGVCGWAYSSKRKVLFDEAAQIPFADEVKNVANTVSIHERSRHE